jgi:hypothetical protein
VSTSFDVPAGIEVGAGDIEVVANGIPSTKTTITVDTGQAPTAFGKSSPSNGATGQATTVTLQWAASSGASSYEYCLDTVNNNACDAASWTNVGAATSVSVGSLTANSTYYWQVRARNGTGTTEADAGTSWAFATAATLPAAFNKTSPANGSTSQPTSLTLSWAASSGATGYEYCLDAVNNSACDTGWTSTGAATSVTVNGLAGGTKYYWQVRARNAAGPREANGGWWVFTTVALPGAFNKSAPANGATGQPTNLTLKWNSSSGAASYEYCVDTVNNGACDSTWKSTGTTTNVKPSGLTGKTKYYWQVRSKNGAGVKESNGGWWAFTAK